MDDHAQKDNVLLSIPITNTGMNQLSPQSNGVNIVILILLLGYPVIDVFGQILVASCARLMRELLGGGQTDKSGWSKLYSISFLRRQLASKLYHNSVHYSEGTILSRVISKLIFGADIDVHCSFTPQLTEPDLTSTGKNVFAANGVQLRNSSFHPGGLVHFGRISIGHKAMILDRSVIDPDTRIEDEVLVGSITHVTEETQHNSRNVLMGVPPLRLSGTRPENQATMSEPLSHSLLLLFCSQYFRLLVELLALIALYSNSLIWICLNNHPLHIRIGVTLVALPLALASFAASQLLICLLVKKLLIGNYRQLQAKGVISVDSWDAFRWGLSNMLIHEACGTSLALVNEYWLTNLFWKMMGATIGEHTKIDPDVLLLEVDMLTIGDHCRVEDEATLLCHKFNKGGLEISPIVLPSHTRVGPRAVILPDSKILDEHIIIEALTPIIPGEELTAGTWRGSPAEKDIHI